MNAIRYSPTRDRLSLEVCSRKGKKVARAGHFTLWWDEDGHLCALDIKAFMTELEEFRKQMRTARLGGIWKGIRISDQEIRGARQEMLRKIEEKW